jgi:thiosulfate dehydrogenase
MSAFLAACFMSVCASAVANDSEQVAKGAKHFEEHCQLCHGADGQKGNGFQTPIWGPQAKIGAKFEKVQDLFEYMQLTMPFDNPKKLNDPQKWEVIAYMLAKHGAMAASDTLDPAKAASLPIK